MNGLGYYFMRNDMMEKEEKSLAIQNCLQQLASEDNFLLTLYYFEEQSLSDILC